MSTAPAPFPDQPAAKPFVPSENAVEALAASLYAQNAPTGVEWSDLGKGPRHPWRSMALTAAVAAGPHLVVSALSHVTSNREQYGFSKALADELTFAQHATDMFSDLEAMLAEKADDSEAAAESSDDTV